MRVMLIALMAVALTVTVVGLVAKDVPTGAAFTDLQPLVVGDVNCDSSVNSIDAALTLQFDAGLVSSLACEENADANGDGRVNRIDAALILQFDAGLIDSLPAVAASGIEGLVTIGPMCPVMQEDTPCPDQPFQATIVIEDEGGDEVATVESAEDGSFRIELAPGSYTLIPQSPNPGAPPHAGEQQVEVEAGAFTEVTIQYDSGIR